MEKKKIVIIVAVIVGSLLLAGGVLASVLLAPEKKIENETTSQETTEAETTDPNAGKVLSRLTGEYINKEKAERRPVAVMYNNIINAIPHSGISNASVVYEAPVEGCITRLMALFENYDKLKKIGSIRSSRIYFPRFAIEWDAIYVHFGQSKYALDFLQSDAVDNIAAYQPIANSIFYRASDRVAPHNTFISGEGINKGISNLEYRKKYKKNFQNHFKFLSDGNKVQLESEKAANKVELGYQVNHPWFEYNQKTGLYYRFQYGEKHIDDQNQEQLSCSNIVIQCVNATYYPDNKSLDMTVTGSGSGWFITNGKAEEVTWKKSKETGNTIYYNKGGDEIVLNTGKTWICIVLNEYKDNIKISK